MTTLRLNAYRIMWLFVFFDLPTNTERDRKNYTRFRKGLQKDGFTMHQYSVYIRHCASGENAEVHIKRVEKMLPPKGLVSIVKITDKQFGMIKNFWGKEQEAAKPPPPQLEMF
ncbi:MAG: CRISPR-associated endonuclease Cas2 [Bacteroidota bacterium]